MLGRDGDDVIGRLRRGFGAQAGGAPCLDDALQRQVAGLGRAAREGDLAGRGVEERRHLHARLVGGVARVPAERVLLAVGVAEPLREERQHGLEDPGVHGRRRVIVKIDGVHLRDQRELRVSETGTATGAS